MCDQLATEPELTISESTTIDTDMEVICNGGVITQTNGLDICIARYNRITIATNKTLVAGGRRALALVADHALAIDGTLDVSASQTVSGPGGLARTDTGTNAGWPNAQGGAGFNTAGGFGGTATVDGGAANGGVPDVDPAELVALVGGGRSYSNPQNLLLRPGGAGGAAILVSCRGSVSIVGLVDAGGGGGQGGMGNIVGSAIVATGGGSGGYVVLQGMNVSVTGQMFANGGGGGAGNTLQGLSGANGADGTRSDTVSAAGGASQNGEGAGGDGGRLGANPGHGKRPVSSGLGAGAGGGSTGFFQTYTPAGVTPTLAPVAASPALQPNRTVEMR